MRHVPRRRLPVGTMRIQRVNLVLPMNTLLPVQRCPGLRVGHPCPGDGEEHDHNHQKHRAVQQEVRHEKLLSGAACEELPLPVPTPAYQCIVYTHLPPCAMSRFDRQ